jgi:chaperonin GroES
VIRPVLDRIVVEAAAKEDKSPGGIILPDSVQGKPQSGLVVAVGPGRTSGQGSLIPADVEVGDLILYGRHSGSEVTVDGKEYVIMRAEDVLGIVG